VRALNDITEAIIGSSACTAIPKAPSSFYFFGGLSATFSLWFSASRFLRMASG